MALFRCSFGCEDNRPLSDPPGRNCEPHDSPYRYAKALCANGRKPLAAVSKKRQAEEQSGVRKNPARSALKRTQRRETAAEKRARQHFNDTVKSWPCWFSCHRPCAECRGEGEVWTQPPEGHIGSMRIPCPVCEGDGKHRCRGPKDAHHVLPKQFIRRMFQAVLPEKEFVAILFNPKIGAPLCRYGAHEPIERKQDRIYWEDLSEECIEYAGSLPDFCLIELERQCPKRELEQAA